MSDFKQFTSNGGEWVDAQQCIHVKTPHLLTQIAGYSKFKCGQSGGQVHFRGQSKVYPTMMASLYRTPPKEHPKTEVLHTAINKYLKELRDTGATIGGTPERAFEPLLQHYGMRTRWVDAVDNIWVALWFACHVAHARGQFDR